MFECSMLLVVVGGERGNIDSFVFMALRVYARLCFHLILSDFCLPTHTHSDPMCSPFYRLLSQFILHLPFNNFIISYSSRRKKKRKFAKKKTTDEYAIRHPFLVNDRMTIQTSFI